MLEKITFHLVHGKLFCGLEHVSQNGTDLINGIVLQKKKNEIDTHSSFQEKNISAISKQLKKEQHISLVINNEHVLTKQIANTETDDLKLIYLAFPNIKIDDIYYEISRQASVSFISICRRSYVDSLIQEYKASNLNIISICLGSLIAATIVNYVECKQILTSNSIITTNNHLFENIEVKTDEKIIDYNINGLKINSQELLSLASALQTIVGQNTSSSNLDITTEVLTNQFKEIRFFKLFLNSAIVFFLGILLINFLFYTHYYNEVSNLKMMSDGNQSSQEELIHLKNKVDEAQKMTEDLLTMVNSKSSYYINDIIQSLPETILLSELNYHPLTKKIQREKVIKIDQETVLIIGESINNESFTKWIRTLEKKEWINTVMISDYGDVSKSKSSFKILLEM